MGADRRQWVTAGMRKAFLLFEAVALGALILFALLSGLFDLFR